jgi:hypothetical protein
MKEAPISILSLPHDIVLETVERPALGFAVTIHGKVGGSQSLAGVMHTIAQWCAVGDEV